MNQLTHSIYSLRKAKEAKLIRRESKKERIIIYVLTKEEAIH